MKTISLLTCLALFLPGLIPSAQSSVTIQTQGPNLDDPSPLFVVANQTLSARWGACIIDDPAFPVCRYTLALMVGMSPSFTLLGNGPLGSVPPPLSAGASPVHSLEVPPAQFGYLGFVKTGPDGPHYGWIDWLNLGPVYTGGDPRASVVVWRVGYESEPNRPVIYGTATSIPEPTGTLLLACIPLLLRRRRSALR